MFFLDGQMEKHLLGNTIKGPVTIFTEFNQHDAENTHEK